MEKEAAGEGDAGGGITVRRSGRSGSRLAANGGAWRTRRCVGLTASGIGVSEPAVRCLRG